MFEYNDSFPIAPSVQKRRKKRVELVDRSISVRALRVSLSLSLSRSTVFLPMNHNNGYVGNRANFPAGREKRVTGIQGKWILRLLVDRGSLCKSSITRALPKRIVKKPSRNARVEYQFAPNS